MRRQRLPGKRIQALGDRGVRLVRLFGGRLRREFYPAARCAQNLLLIFLKMVPIIDSLRQG